MVKTLTRLIGVMLMVMSGSALAGINPDTIDFESLTWHDALIKQGVTVKVAKVTGHSIKAFRATATYNASLHQIVNAITDMSRFTDWMHEAQEAYVAERLADNVQACYFRNNTPWPLQDRDGVIVQSLSVLSESKVRIHLNLMNELVPEHKDYTRVEHLEGDWFVEQVSDGQVQVTYQIHLDPVGVPGWAVNFMITDTPYQSLKKLADVDFSVYGEQVPELMASELADSPVPSS